MSFRYDWTTLLCRSWRRNNLTVRHGCIFECDSVVVGVAIELCSQKWEGKGKQIVVVPLQPGGGGEGSFRAILVSEKELPARSIDWFCWFLRFFATNNRLDLLICSKVYKAKRRLQFKW